MNIHQLLKHHREQNNLTQEELAQKVYVSRQAVSKWERGEALPEIETIILIAQLYDISIDELLQGVQHLRKPVIIGEENLKFKISVAMIPMALFAVFFIKDAFWIFFSLMFIHFCGLINIYKLGQITLGRKQLMIQSYSNLWQRLRALVQPNRYRVNANYDDIDVFRIEYIARLRTGYADIHPDIFRIALVLKDGSTTYAKVTHQLQVNLPLIAKFVEAKGVTVRDHYGIVQMIQDGTSIYEGVQLARKQKSHPLY